MADICRENRKIGIWLLTAVILLTGCAAPAPTEMGTGQPSPEQALDPYAWAYYEFLQECILNGSTPIGVSRGIPIGIWDQRFGLVFIDEDDIPELLIFEDDCHAAAVEVYTYV